MDRRRLLAKAGDPPIVRIDERPATQQEKRAAATNKREYDRETGAIPNRSEAADEHRKTIEKSRGIAPASI